MPTIAGILTVSIYEQDKFHAQLADLGKNHRKEDAIVIYYEKF